MNVFSVTRLCIKCFNWKPMLAALKTVENLLNEARNRPCNYRLMHALFYICSAEN